MLKLPPAALIPPPSLALPVAPYWVAMPSCWAILKMIRSPTTRPSNVASGDIRGGLSALETEAARVAARKEAFAVFQSVARKAPRPDRGEDARSHRAIRIWR
jgi:hypothetical protein